MKFLVMVMLSFVTFFRVCNATYNRQTNPISYYNHKDFVIHLRIHIDLPLKEKLTKLFKTKYMRKIRIKIQNILHKAQKLFMHPSLKESVVLDVKEVKFLINHSEMSGDLNTYLKSYCEWQAEKKLSAKPRFYSVLLTGLDLYHLSRGVKDKSRTGRGYLGGMCTLSRSCAIVEWDDASKIAYNIAHEIGHSLGMYHDPPTKGYRNIMAQDYVYKKTKEIWSPTSRRFLKNYLSSLQAWCLRPNLFYQ